MITDAILNPLFVVLEALVNLLPDMPAMPEGIREIFGVFGNVDFFVPMSEFLGFLPVIGVFVVGFVIWRFVRFLWIGGG